MGKYFYRRYWLLLKISVIFFIIFTIIFHLKRTDFFSLLKICPSTENYLIQSATIPSRYLLIPYNQYVTRTSISCHSFKLDRPKRNLAALHPIYSSYLRGQFSFVIPHSNITFNDIENFYQNKTRTGIKSTLFASNITFETVPYRYKNGMWYPNNVISAQRIAILVPLQGRAYNAKTFLLNMHAFARRQLLTYTILLIEQIHPFKHRFNKGRLLNTGVRYIEKHQSLNITCLVLHDVDLIPENDGNFYSCESIHPKHTTIQVRQLNGESEYTRFYEFLIGGVLILTLDMYKKLNGFSNLYWGWGGEDDDLSLRFIERRMCVVRPSDEVATYIALPHRPGQRNPSRFRLLAWSTVRLNRDGYKQIRSMTNIVHIRKLSTVVHLKVNVDANRSRYKPPLIKKFRSPSNTTNHYLTGTHKTVKRQEESP